MRSKSEPSSSTEYLLTVDGVAERCGVSRRTVFAWIASGDLAVIRFGTRVVRVRGDDLDALIERRRSIRR